MRAFLLLPDDEPTLVAHLLEDEGLTRLAHDDLAFGPPVVGPLARPPALPEPSGPEPTRFIFWVPPLGDLVVRDGARLDEERSPILVWQRARWHATGALCPGRLRTQSRPRKDQPRALLELHERVERWLKREGIRVDRDVWALPHAARWIRDGGSVVIE